MFTSITHLFRSWRRYGTAMRELSRLSDRELADIGISRSDIPRLAREHAYHAHQETYPQHSTSLQPALSLQGCPEGICP